MKTVLLLLFLALTVMVSTSSLAVVDPTPNRIGLFWDDEGNSLCRYTTTELINLHLVYTYPFYNVIDGFECGIDIVGDAYILSAEFANPTALDLAAGFQNFIVGFGTPTYSSEANLLVTLQILPSSDTLEFYLHQSSPPSVAGNLPVIIGDGELRQIGVTAIYNGASAIMELGTCCGVVSTEQTNWDSVKSMYR